MSSIHLLEELTLKLVKYIQPRWAVLVAEANEGIWHIPEGQGRHLFADVGLNRLEDGLDYRAIMDLTCGFAGLISDIAKQP